MKDQYNILFLCTANSARSILAEALANHVGHGRLRAFSAGSQPSGTVQPMALEVLRDVGVPTEGLRSKSWDEFGVDDAPQMDIIVTVCGNAAGETCPVWPGHPLTAHWGVDDPAAVQGSEDERRHAFTEAMKVLRHRIDLLLSLRPEALDRLAMQSQLRAIGQQAG